MSSYEDAHVFLSVLYEGGRRRGAVPYEHGVTCSSAWGHGRLPRSHGRLHGTVTVELGPPLQSLIDRSAWDARILARPTQTAVAMSWPMAAPENTRDQRPIIERYVLVDATRGPHKVSRRGEALVSLQP